MIPWRLKNFLSEHFPLWYHLTVNAFHGNNPNYWDRTLERDWEDPARTWPTKSDLICRLTNKSDNILDIACGNGSILRYLKAQGYESLHGLEISSYAVNRLRVEGITMHIGTVPLLPIPHESFDVVIASQILEHVIRRRRFVKEINRILKPGGHALFFVPDDCLGPIDEHEHVIKYRDQTLTKFLQNYFTVLTVHTIRDANHEIPILFAHVEKSGKRRQDEFHP